MKKNSMISLSLLLILAVSLIVACGKKEKESASEKKGNLTEEFTLKKSGVEEGASVIEDVLFGEGVSVAKISSFSHDSTGTSLGYALKDGDTEKLIKLLQDTAIMGVEITKEEYQAATKSVLSGYMIEFMDKNDNFDEGVARISCVTNTGKYYVNVINKKKPTKVYRFSMPDAAVDYLNEKSEENYEKSSNNPGWFDKAFGTKD